MKAALLPIMLSVAAAATAETLLYEAPATDMEARARSEAVATNIPSQWPPKAERLWLEIWCADSGEDMVEIAVNGGKGAKGAKRGFCRYRADLPEKGRRGVSIPWNYIRGGVDVTAVSNVTVLTADGEPRRFGVSRMLVLGPGEEAPTIDEAPRPRVRDAAAHHECYLKFKDECRMGAFVVGQATSMENIRPRAAFKWRDAGEVFVRLARGERESVQILVAPAVHDLKGVSVSVVMEGGANADFANTNITASVVGYVETRDPPPYTVRPNFARPPRGWWPDPILGFQRSCDISGEDVQSFWLRVTCPEDQPAGTYTGKLYVSAANAVTVETRFSVRVNDFAVGRGSPLPIAVSSIYPSIYGNEIGGRNELAKRIKEDPNGFHNAWKSNWEKYCDFFADYWITTDSLYVNRDREPNWEMLARLKGQGRLGMFNLCFWWYMGLGPEGEARWRRDVLPLLRARYEKAKELGIEKHAYFYGCDELGPKVFTNIALTVAALHKEFPGVPVMTTALDTRLGTGSSPLKEVDIHCPHICFWDGRPVKKARAQGRQVWWYFCNAPATPFANTTLEGPPIEIRSFMGAQTQKFKPDGFLYYATTHWNSLRPIDKGPFTDWNPRSYSFYHGDGQWTCCGGPERLPLATLRLENFRDGLEDLWYVRKLERLFAAHVDKNDGWAKAARDALSVPNEVARSLKDFSTDPAVLYRWRDEMADLIEEALEK